MYMVRTTSSNRYMSIVLLSTIGSGVTHGMHGIVPGTGVIGRDGGTHTLAGHMTGIGITATPIITITTAARSVTRIIRVMAITNCTKASLVASMQRNIPIVRSHVVTTV